MDERVWQHRVDQLRKHRTRPDKDLTLTGLRKSFQREVARPFKQLDGLAEVWSAWLPEALLEQTRLEGLARGTLRVTVTNAAARYEVDRLLREGLQQELVAAQPGSLRKIKLTLGAIADGGPGGSG